MKPDGTDVKRFTEESIGGPIGISSDSKFLYCVRRSDKNLIRLPVDGGPSTTIGSIGGFLASFALSQNDDEIAKLEMGEAGANPTIRIYSIKNGKLIKTIELPKTATNSRIAWTPDRHGMAFLDSRNGDANIWATSLDKKSLAKPVTNFTTPSTVNFEWTRDGKQLVVSRATTINDAMMITNAKQ